MSSDFCEVDWDRLARTGRDLRTEDEVFDELTLRSLMKLISGGDLDILDFPLSTGKEGNVFRGVAGGELVAVKIYRVSTATFKHILKYLHSPHLSYSRNHRQLIYQWARKEYTNLVKLWDVGVRVPRPRTFLNNVVIMEYIGSRVRPAPLLQQVVPRDPGAVYRKVLRDVRSMYGKAGLVHGDLSEYNILMYRGRPRIIDVGQTVSRDHPMAGEFLERDVRTLGRYFGRFFPVDFDEMLGYITGGGGV